MSRSDTCFVSVVQVLAPTDKAFKELRTRLAGPGRNPLSEEDILELPELKHILLYHIVPGEWTSEYLKNNTGIYTSKGVEVVPFADGAMTEGKIMLHDSCVDKPTPDPYDCTTQVEFNKCLDPFMVSPLGAQWQGGFCQRTCQRCSCDPSLGSYCAEVRERMESVLHFSKSVPHIGKSELHVDYSTNT